MSSGPTLQVVRFESHPETGFVYLKDLTGKEWSKRPRTWHSPMWSGATPAPTETGVASGGPQSWAEHGVEVGERPLDED